MCDNNNNGINASSNTVITKQAVESMTKEELLVILKEYEGNGRSVRFQENAVTKEKKEKSIPYTFDFSWSFLTNLADRKGLRYSEDKWCISDNELPEDKDIILVRTLEGKRKRTVEATAEAFRHFDELAEKLPFPKALLMTEALERFVSDVQNEKITFSFKL